MIAAPSPSAAPLTVRGLTKHYDAGVALNAVTFTAPAGEVTAILGASGSGKSTLLRLIAGLERPDAGTIALGADIVSGPERFVPAERRRIGLVFQDYAVFPHLTALANVQFGLDGMDKAEARRVAQMWLDRVGLGMRGAAFPHELSGGEQQRVALARALAPSPRVLGLDEPFSGLDADLRASLRDTTLATLRAAHITALFVTHDAEDAMAAADQIVILHRGTLEQAGPPRSVYDNPVSLRAALALGPINQLAARATAGGVSTPFGTISTSLPDGPVVLAVRPEAVLLTSGDTVAVVDRRPAGAKDVLTLQLDGAAWRAHVEPNEGQAPGERAGLSLANRGVFAFPAD